MNEVLPAGFTMDPPVAGMDELPAEFTVDPPAAGTDALPEGFTLDPPAPGMDELPAEFTMDPPGRGFIERQLTAPGEYPKGVVRSFMQTAAMEGPTREQQFHEGTVALRDEEIGRLEQEVAFDRDRVSRGIGQPKPPGIIESFVGIFKPPDLDKNRFRAVNAPSATDEDRARLKGNEERLAAARAERADALAKSERSRDTADRWMRASQTGWLEIPKDEGVLGHIARVGGQAAGSLAVSAGVGAATGSPLAGASVLGELQGMGEWSKARQAGLSVAEANRAYALETLAATALEYVPLERWKKMTGGAAARFLKNGSIEAAQEVADTIKTAALERAQGFRDPNASLGMETLDAALGGFLAAGSRQVVEDATDFIRAKYEARVPFATPEAAESMLKGRYGDGAVKRMDADTVVLTLPNGKTKAFRFVKSAGEFQGGTPEGFLDRVAKSDPDAAAEALEEADGDRAKAGLRLMRTYEETGLTVKNVTVKDPVSGAEVPVDALMQIVAGRARIGVLSHEEFHGLVKLADADGFFEDEEQLAEAIEAGENHPAVQRVKDEMRRIVNMFRRSPTETVYQTATRARDAMRKAALAADGTARTEDPVSGLTAEQRRELRVSSEAAARQFDARNMEPGDDPPAPMLDAFGRPIGGPARDVQVVPGPVTAGPDRTLVTQTIPAAQVGAAPGAPSLERDATGRLYLPTAENRFQGALFGAQGRPIETPAGPGTAEGKMGQGSGAEPGPVTMPPEVRGSGVVTTRTLGPEGLNVEGQTGTDLTAIGGDNRPKQGAAPVPGEGAADTIPSLPSDQPVAPAAQSAAEPLKGGAGDLTADAFGEGQTSLFNERRDTPQANEIQRRDGRPAKRHQTITRVALAPEYPGLRPAAADPAAKYQPQSLREIAARVEAMPEGEQLARLAALDRIGETDSQENDLGAIMAARVMKLHAAGKYAEARSEVLRAGRNFGAVAQILRQAAMLKTATPAGMVLTVEALADAQGAPLTDRARDRLTGRASEDIKARDGLMTAEEQFGTTPTDETARKLTDAQRRAADASRRFVSEATAYVPKEWADIIRMLIQGNTLAVPSLVTNTIANVVNQPLRFVSQTIAATAEGAAKLFRIVNKRTVGQPAMDVAAAARGFARALRQDSGGIVRTGLANSRIHAAGEIYRGFQPVAAWRRLLTEPGLSLNQRAKLIVEGTFGIPAEVMFRGLTLSDAPTYGGQLEAAKNNIGRTLGLSGRHLDAFVRVPPPEARKLAEERALEAVYQSDRGITSQVFQAVSRAGLGKQFGDAGKMFNAVLWRPTVMLFSKTPANLISEGNGFANPFWSLASFVYHASHGNQREAFVSFGKLATGCIMYSVAMMIARAGLLGANGNDEKKRALAQTPGQIKPMHINRSGLERMMRGQSPSPQPGDETMDYRQLGYFGIILSIVSSGRDRFLKEAYDTGKPLNVEPSMVDIALRAFPAVPGAVLDLGMMKGAWTLMDAVRRKDYDNWFVSWFGTVANGVLPRSLILANRTTAQWIPEKEYRGTDPTLAAGMESIVRTAINDLKTRVWAADKLPPKRDMLGRPVLATPPGKNPVLYHMLDPTRRQDLGADRYGMETAKVFDATLDRDVIPTQPEDHMAYTDHQGRSRVLKLSDRQFDRYQELAGLYRMYAMNQLFQDPRWERAPAELKARAMKHAIDRGREEGKERVLREIFRGLK